MAATHLEALASKRRFDEGQKLCGCDVGSDDARKCFHRELHLRRTVDCNCLWPGPKL